VKIVSDKVVRHSLA